MKVTSISRKLLTRVLSFYFILTFSVTCIQIAAEYYNTKSHINNELLVLEKTFSGSLTRAVWELNTQQAVDIAEGLVAIPMIKGISITDESDQVVAQLGDVASEEEFKVEPSDEKTDYLSISSISEGLFGHTFPLIFEFSGRTTRVGTVTLLSSNEEIFNRIEVGIYFLIGNAILKTAFLIFLFSLAFEKLLTQPLSELTEQIKQIDHEDPEASKLHSAEFRSTFEDKNELNVLEDAYNNLIDELVEHKEQLALAQNEITASNDKLDEHNLILEQEVARKTSSLSKTMLNMEIQQRELLQQQSQLKEENTRREKTEFTLTETNKELKSSILELNKAKKRLLASEKMASLGNLSAEVSHEVNTPIGVGITSTSYLSDLLNNLTKDIEEQKLTKRSIDDFVRNAQQSVELLMNNLARASDLMTSYKQIAVDQISDKMRQINMTKYLDEIIQSLRPRLKKANHSITINCANDIEIYSHAGAIAQIFTNLIINSIIHGFENIQGGEITIDIKMHEQTIKIHYQDNGVGLNQEQLEKLYEPFFTTKATQGGSGLGTHIVHDLVTDTLNGKIEASSELGEGLNYYIEFESMR